MSFTDPLRCASVAIVRRKTWKFSLGNPSFSASGEASLNPTQDFGTRIRAISYDAPAFKNAEEFRTAFEEAEKRAHESAKTKFKAEGDLILYVEMCIRDSC